MLIFADALECLLQFGVVGFFLLLSFISWVVKKVSAEANRRSLQRRMAQQPEEGPIAPPKRTPPRNPYLSEADDQGGAPVMAAEVIEATEHRHLSPALQKDEFAPPDTDLGYLEDSPEPEIHELFDHEVGKLGDSSDAIHEDPDADKIPEEAVTVREIADVFRHPERIREAIILNEILTRPEDRW